MRERCVNGRVVHSWSFQKAVVFPPPAIETAPFAHGGQTMKKRTPHLRLIGVLASILILAATLLALFWPPSEARAAVAATWRSARDAGGYSFRADVVQQVIPVATFTNV